MPEANILDLVIADDHAMVRQGIMRLFAGVADMRIIADTDNGDDLIELIRTLRPAVALVDISMPGPGPAGIAEQVDALGSTCRLLALTMHFEPSFAEELLTMGMAGYVIKDAAFDELLDAVRAVAGGDQYLSRELLSPTVSTRLPHLTGRERECLRLAANGETSDDIALRLGITERTVRFHVANSCQKLGVQRRSQAIVKAHKLKIL